MAQMPTAVIILFWTLQFIGFSLDRLARAPEGESWSTIQSRVIITALGVLISLVMLKVLRSSASLSFFKRALVAITLAMVAAALHGVINMLVFWTINGPPPGETFSFEAIAPYLPSLIFFFSWVYLAIAIFLLSITYGENLLQQERRIAELVGEADRARLSALRYQLNPHFLFNSLNSAASLVAARRNRDAEAMLENLADFLRSTLQLDAEKEITLRDELALQSLYLEMEQIRFPHRLRVVKEVSEELLDVLVPNLITQPLIENSMKHAVAHSTRRVCLSIIAREVGGKLRISVKDSGGNAGIITGNGLGLGLQNVAKRLKIHFGEEAEFQAGPTADGGFESQMAIPSRRGR
ncbi:MAG: histidine kinase [Sphingomonas sp.]|nr:histidine kinase [Sphingomonas sp.]